MGNTLLRVIQIHFRILQEKTRFLNDELAEQQRRQRDSIEKIYSYNQPTQEFFDNFGIHPR